MEQINSNYCHLISSQIRRYVKDEQAEERRGKVGVHLLFLKENPEGVDCIATEHFSSFWGQSGDGWGLGIGFRMTCAKWTVPPVERKTGQTWQLPFDPVHESRQLDVN
jgi:hypothetical protein